MGATGTEYGRPLRHNPHINTVIRLSETSRGLLRGRQNAYSSNQAWGCVLGTGRNDELRLFGGSYWKAGS